MPTLKKLDPKLKEELEEKLRRITHLFRIKMLPVREYKNYILGTLFYKYLSEKQENLLDNMTVDDGRTLKEAFSTSLINKELIHLIRTQLGYYIEPRFLLSEIVKNTEDESLITTLDNAFNNVINSSIDRDDFENIFNDIKLDSMKLGKTRKSQNKAIEILIKEISEINIPLDAFGETFDYLLDQFARIMGRRAGYVTTPPELSTLMAKLVTVDKKENVSAYDPACGVGSSLIDIAKEANVTRLLGNDMNPSAYNHARMNMIVNNIPFEVFDIKCKDSLELMEEIPNMPDTHFVTYKRLNENYIIEKFDIAVSQPPFGLKWNGDKRYLNDVRFKKYGAIAPRSRADYAFIQDMLYHIKDDGIMAIILQTGVLSRGLSEKTIRKYLLENNYIDAIIRLPKNIFYATAIPTVIMILKKNRSPDDDILFIDTSDEYAKTRKQNKLRDKDIEKIVETYKNREEIERYSHKATMDEIKENQYNLHVPRYVNTFEKIEPVNMDRVFQEDTKITLELKDINQKIEDQCKKMNIDPNFRGGEEL